MPNDYRGILIVSDIDGTLIRKDGQIPRRNRDAIERFTGQGGLFTIASGRSVSSIRGAIGELPVNCPVIAYNGSMIYDLERDTVVVRHELSDIERAYVRRVHDGFSDSTVEVYADDACYLLRNIEGDRLRSPIFKETLEIVPCHFDEVPKGPWIKASFMVPEDVVDRFMAFLRDNPQQGATVIASSGRYFEIIPQGITKGTMLRVLAQSVGVPIEKTIAVGDYYNDLEMLKAAGVGMCVAGAPEELRAVCAYELGPCDEGAIGDVLQILDAGGV